MIIHELTQGTPEWKKVRRGKVTASMFGVAKGKGKTRTEYMEALVRERKTGISRPTVNTPCMQIGTDTEPLARKEYEKRNDLKVREVGFVELSENIGASPDGLVGDDGDLEIKCPKKTTHEKTLADCKVPMKYMPQIQGTMWVTGRKWCDFVSYCPSADEPYFCKRVYYDEAYVIEMKIRIYMFVSELKEMIEKTKGATMDAEDAEVYASQYEDEIINEFETKGSDMQVTGQIQNVQAAIKDGFPETFTTQNGQFYVFIMTVNGQTGTINSKSPQYPKQAGEEITVDIATGQHGNKFKAINPQYAQQNQQQGQQQPQQQQPPQQQQSYTPPPQTPPVNDVQASIQFGQALNLTCQDRVHNVINITEMANQHHMYLTILQTKQFPAQMFPAAGGQGQNEEIPF